RSSGFSHRRLGDDHPGPAPDPAAPGAFRHCLGWLFSSLLRLRDSVRLRGGLAAGLRDGWNRILLFLGRSRNIFGGTRGTAVSLGLRCSLGVSAGPRLVRGLALVCRGFLRAGAVLIRAVVLVLLLAPAGLGLEQIGLQDEAAAV